MDLQDGCHTCDIDYYVTPKDVSEYGVCCLQVPEA